MKKTLFFIAFALAALAACNSKKETKVLKQTDFLQPPVAEMIPDTFTEFGNVRIDNYFWMRDKTNPRVIEYLKAENAYTDAVMTSTKSLQEKIYDEIVARIKEDDETYPAFDNGYYYYKRVQKGKQYPTYCRKKGSLDAPEEITFDVNKMAVGKSAYMFSGNEVSPDNSMSAYFYNETGSFADYTLKIRNLITGKDLDFQVKGATSFAWANDNKTVFYGTIDAVSLRSYRIYRHTLGSSRHELIFEEEDPKFSVGVTDIKTHDFVIISSNSSTTSEEWLIPADRPMAEPIVFRPRKQDVDYNLYPHKDCFFIQYKDRDNLNSKIYQAPLQGFEDMHTWKEVIAHDNEARIESIDIQKEYLVVELRKNGLSEIHVRNINTGNIELISFPEPVYTAYLNGNPEYDVSTFRYTYTSLNRPTTLYEYDASTGKTKKLKQQEIPSGFNPDDYVVERLWATADDGVKVPMAIVYKKELKKDSSNPALLYSYGSYGHSSDVFFSTSFYSLIDRGFVLGIAQIRGGSDMGEQWYEDGKLLKKKNTFTDFIACASTLIAEKYTSPQHLAAMGGSAGGLLMGVVANMRPNLFNTIVAQVPFVDVISTMLDESLPLTTGEYEEWGDPNEEEYYRYMLSYSPYDNIKAQDYPNILVTGGINDSQVLFHEPTKYTAKLRTLKTDQNILILHMDMDSGHGGATGRYDSIKDTAFEFAFILNREGIER